MSKRSRPDEDDEEERHVYAPPGKMMREMTVDELVLFSRMKLMQAPPLDEAMLDTLFNAFTNVAVTWDVKDWIRFTSTTKSWSGLGDPAVMRIYNWVWRRIFHRDFYSAVRHRAGRGDYQFVRNIDWYWRNVPGANQNRDYWRRAYFGSKKFLHYLLELAAILYMGTEIMPRPDEDDEEEEEARPLMPTQQIIPDSFRPWLHEGDVIRNVETTNRALPSRISGSRLPPHTLDQQRFRPHGRMDLGVEPQIIANTTGIALWPHGQYHRMPLRLATEGLPSPYVIAPGVVMHIELSPLVRLRTRLPDLRLLYVPGQQLHASLKMQSDFREVYISINPGDSTSDIHLIDGDDKILLGTGLPLAEFRLYPEDPVPEIEFTLAMQSVDAEVFAIAIESLHTGRGPLASYILQKYLFSVEEFESSGMGRLSDSTWTYGTTPEKLEVNHRTIQLEGWPLFVQFCMTDDPSSLLQRPHAVDSAPLDEYFTSLDDLFHEPPDDKRDSDPFRTVAQIEEFDVGAMAPPRRNYILFACSICAAPATHCALETPTQCYCRTCARTS